MAEQPVTSPQEIAEAAARAMYERDYAAHALGITLLSVAPGRARMAMAVRADMVNGHDMGHGGLTFALADTAFAYACNSYNTIAVAQHAEITFLSPTRRGERLTAEAEERSRAGRNGVYDVTVYGEDGRAVALFRGLSARLKGEVAAGLTATV